MLTDYEQIKSRKKWNNGVIAPTNRGSSTILMLSGGFFGALGLYSIFERSQAFTLELNKDKLVLIFPTICFLILTFGLIKLLRTVKFRKAKFIIANVPTSIGTTLKGRLILPANKIPNDAEIEISLINEEIYTTGHARNKNTLTNTLSEYTINIAISQFSKDYKFPDTIACDISIPINEKGRGESDDFGSRHLGSHRFRWYLKVYSRIPGANLDLDFTLPIYRTQKTS